MQGLVLASGSRYRSALLSRLGIPFRSISPDVDESPQKGEGPEHLARRLSGAKALRGSALHPAELVIGSDQVAAIGSTLFTKPGTAERAREQLRQSSGREVVFHTAVGLALAGRMLEQRCISTTVRFRDLEEAEIETYVRREAPLDCAGSFRWEGLGITLFRELRSPDPTALEGLPLIALSDMLRNAGLNPITAVD